MRLVEKYRPRTLEEVAGQSDALDTVRGLVRAGIGGRAVWLVGPSGAGKTSIGRILANEIADPFFVEEVVACAVTAERCDDWARYMRMFGGGKGGRAFIINEAHGLRAPIQQRLDQMLEEDLPNHVLFVFTTTFDGQEALFDGIDSKPLLSRCHKVKLTAQGLAKPGAAYLQRIHAAEGLGELSESDAVKMMNRAKNNVRDAVMELEEMLVKSRTAPRLALAGAA